MKTAIEEGEIDAAEFEDKIFMFNLRKNESLIVVAGLNREKIMNKVKYDEAQERYTKDASEENKKTLD